MSAPGKRPKPSFIAERRKSNKGIAAREWKVNAVGLALGLKLAGTKRMALKGFSPKARKILKAKTLAMLGARKGENYSVNFYHRKADGQFFAELKQTGTVAEEPKFFHVNNRELIESLRFAIEKK